MSLTASSASSLVAKYYNLAVYKNENPDLVTFANANSWGSNDYYNHYLNYGIGEGRTADYRWNFKDYTANNPDLRLYANKNNWSVYDYLNDYDASGSTLTTPRVASHFYYKADYLSLNTGLSAYATANPSYNPDLDFTNLKLAGTLGTRVGIGSTRAIASASETNNGAVTAGPNPANPIMMDFYNDTYTGTALDDVFETAFNSNLSALSSGTMVDGLAGRNTLNAVVAGTSVIQPTLNNVQTVLIKAVNDSIVFDGTYVPDVASIGYNGSQYNLGTIQNINFQGTELLVNNTNAAKTYNFLYAASSLNSAKYAFLTLNNAAGTVVINNAGATAAPNNLFITSNGTRTNNVTLTDTGTSYKTIIATGTAPLNISGTTFTALTKLDTTNLTGATTASMSTVAAVNVKTGAGNDVISRTGLLSTDVINLGGGTNNTLLANAADIISTSAAATTNLITNIQTIGTATTSPVLSSAGVTTVDLSKFSGVSNVSFNSGASAVNTTTVINIPSGGLVKLGGASDYGATGHELILTQATGATTLNTELVNSQTYHIASGTATTLNVQADAAAGIDIKSTTPLTTIKVTGKGSANFSNTTGTTWSNSTYAVPNTVTSVDASALVGAFLLDVAIGGSSSMTIKGSLTGNNDIGDGNTNDTIIGGPVGTDTFHMARGLDTFTGNGGVNNYIVGGSGLAVFDATHITTNKATITDFAPGTNSTNVDQLIFSKGGFGVGTAAQLISLNGAATAPATATVGNGANAFLSYNNAPISSVGGAEQMVFANGASAAAGYASSTALATMLNSNPITLNGAATLLKSILVAYRNTTDGCIDVALVSLTTGATTTAGCTASDIIKLQGVTDFTNIDGTDFAFVA